MNVGRPPIYENDESRKESRRIQNRETQRKCRLRKKLIEVTKSVSLSPQEKDKRYKKELIKYLSRFKFNYFFTGTIDPDFMERRRLKTLNEEINRINLTLETDLNYQIDKKVGIKSLRKYTENYIQFLTNRGLILRCFVVFELCKNNKYHVHIMFQTLDGIRNFNTYSEDHWLMGISLTNPIETELDKVKLLTYCVKKLQPSSRKIHNMNLLDNWFLEGSFSRNPNMKNEISDSKSPSSVVFYCN
jgi:hypothetical protein